MKKEIDVALDILLAYVQRFGSIKDQTMEQFRLQLEQILLERYQGHWYPDKPIKGQAYRSLEFNKDNDYCDAIVSQICQQLGFASNLLGIRHDLTLWIDPYEITIRLGNHASPKENQQLVVVRFDHQGNELIRNDLDTLLSQSRLPLTNSNARSSPTNSSSCDSASCSGSSTPQRTSSPFPFAQTSTSSLSSMIPPSTTLFHNGPLFTTPRALSPQAPAFQMSPSAPIKVPLHQQHQLAVYQTNEPNSSEGSPSDGNHFQPDRSDTPHSMNSTTSNESSDSGYCGYVESFPYYYKLNRLYKALAIQKLSMNNVPTSRGGHSQRRQQGAGYAHGYPQQQQQQQHQHQHHQNPHPHATNAHHVYPNGNIPSPNLSSSPPTPTPMNINQFSPFYAGQSPFLPMPTTISDSRKSKY